MLIFLSLNLEAQLHCESQFCLTSQEVVWNFQKAVSQHQWSVFYVTALAGDHSAECEESDTVVHQEKELGEQYGIYQGAVCYSCIFYVKQLACCLSWTDTDLLANEQNHLQFYVNRYGSQHHFGDRI